MAFDTTQPAQVTGLNGYTVDPLITIGDQINGYIPPGIPDGMGAIALDENTVRLFVNHELTNTAGYTYSLDNGAELVGARVSYFDIDKTTRTVVDAGLAYDTIFNRAGEIVDEATDLEFEGLNRFCSAQLIEANQFGSGNGFADAIFFTGEETSGGTEFALDVATGQLWAVPWLGRAAWESVTELDTGSTDSVALLVGDDRQGAPLLLYVGEKNAVGDGSFLDRNGLAQGKLYVWTADSGETTPEEFNGTFEGRSGKFVEIDYYRPDLASADGSTGYDAQGFATQAQQDTLAFEVAGGFMFSRPEDVATNPADGTQAVLASTGRDSLFPADSWGTTYKIDVDFNDLATGDITAQVDVLYDGDDAGGGQFAGPDFGLRSPDNLDWADNGQIYIQEDRSFDDFGLTSGAEASIWKLDPGSGALTRVAQMDRTGVPAGQTDPEPNDIGNWESSGIIDVSTLFGEDPGELFLFNTQAHSLEDGIIETEGLVQGGQIAFLSGPADLTHQGPLVIGHRGASGSRPEHTLASYELAIELGADFIEPDLVVTKDGVLVARHENEISGTSDVADRPEFADRQTTKVIDGTEFTGWFVEDFTLAELKTLRAKERIPSVRPDNTAFDGQFEIPTLLEVIDLVKTVEAETGKQIGIYPETKHPTFLAKEGTFLDGTPINLDTSQLLVDTLIAEGFTDPNRIFIQSFEVQNLIEIQDRLNAEGFGDIPLVQLYGDTTATADPADAFSYPYDIRYNVEQGENLAAIYGQAFLDAAENPLSAETVYGDLDNAVILQVISDRYAEGAGPWKNNLLLREALDTPVDGNGDGIAQITSQLTGEVTSFIDDAHAAGLQVHPYTHRNEENFLTLNADGTPQTPESELVQLISIGVDGFFTDFPGTGDAVRDRYGIAGTEFDTVEPPQVLGLSGYTVDPFFTVGETYGGYTPPGIPDGIGAFALDGDTIRILVNHELNSEDGYAYTLANGAAITGARVSFFDINKGSLAVEDAGLAYDTILNRQGEVVDEASDLEYNGIDRLCSAAYIPPNQFGDGRGLVDGLFFTGEETSGGTEFVLDPTTNTLHAVPWMGRAAWESVTELDTGTADKVALLIGDDRQGAPLLMYVGTKDTSPNAGLLERNGLANGKLYAWAANSGETTPEEFNGTFAERDGGWVEIDFYDLAQAGTAVVDEEGNIDQSSLGYDADGFATQAQQDTLAAEAGAFQFSRPEDVATNPEDGTVAVLASTGRDSLFPADSWGTTYIIDTDFDAAGEPIAANVKAIYDGDDAGAGQFAGPDFGVRSPDNLDWADDGFIYIQEDRSISDFGLSSGEETSIWKLDPESGELTRVAQVDRTAIPFGQVDGEPDDLGNWESSGILDVSTLFGQAPGSLLVFGIQAHSIEGGLIDAQNLVQGGQLAFLTNDSLFEPDTGALSDLIDLTGIDGDVVVDITVTREATFDNVLRFYETDAQGRVDGLMAGDSGYEAAVAANLLDAELFTDNLVTTDVNLTLPGGTYYAPVLLVDGNINNLATIGESRIQREGNVWRFEDLFDNDFNDLVITINSAEPVAA